MYNLDYLSAISIVVNGGAVRGENFREFYYLKTNAYGQLVLVNVDDFYKEETFVSIKSLSTQKFREVSILTKSQLSK